eukprot:2649742-Pleurochrysis_carterae.AAC.1
MPSGIATPTAGGGGGGGGGGSGGTSGGGSGSSNKTGGGGSGSSNNTGGGGAGWPMVPVSHCSHGPSLGYGIVGCHPLGGGGTRGGCAGFG